MKYALGLLDLRVAVVLQAAVFWAATAGPATAQSSSLFGEPGGRRPMPLSQYSWTYQPPLEAEPIRLNDLLTVMVDEKSQVISEGEMDRRKKANGKVSLKDWILLESWNAFPDPQTPGDPTIDGEMENKFRAESEMETRDAMKFRIACRVVDIRPNGNLVIEGRRTIQNNEDVWEQSLTGVVRPEDVLPNNTVLSENVAELRVFKREAGHVRDGYRRGWLLKWMDGYQPF